VLMTGWLTSVPALVETYFPGQEGGNALAAILFGEVTPSGKLPDTLGARREDYPDYGHFPGVRGRVDYAEGIVRVEVADAMWMRQMISLGGVLALVPGSGRRATDPAELAVQFRGQGFWRVAEEAQGDVQAGFDGDVDCFIEVCSEEHYAFVVFKAA